MPVPRPGHRGWFAPIIALLACAIPALAPAGGLAIAPAWGQSPARLGPLCAEGPSADVVIGGCTQQIDTGNLSANDLATALALRGAAYYQARSYALAFADYTRATQLVPNNAGYHRGLGLARGNLKRDSGDALANATQIEQALSDFNQAARLDPKDPVTLVRRGEAYVALGRIERGLDDLNQAIVLRPDLALAHESRGMAYREIGDNRKALDDFAIAIRLQPANASIHLNNGLSHDALAEHKQAINAFDEAIRLDPSSAEAFNARGVSYAKQGKTDRALEDFDQAIVLNPGFADAYFNRGNAYYLKGDKDRAVANFIQARQLNPRFPEVPDTMFESFDIDVPDSFGSRRPFSR